MFIFIIIHIEVTKFHGDTYLYYNLEQNEKKKIEGKTQINAER